MFVEHLCQVKVFVSRMFDITVRNTRNLVTSPPVCEQSFYMGLSAIPACEKALYSHTCLELIQNMQNGFFRS